MNIQYLDKIPTKMEVYEIMDSIQSEEEVKTEINENLLEESDDIVTTVCAYHLERIIGIGRVKKEGDMLYVQDIIIKPEYDEEEIKNNIIVSLVRQVNELTKYSSSIKRCLEFGEKEENFFDRFSFLAKDKQELGA